MDCQIHFEYTADMPKGLTKKGQVARARIVRGAAEVVRARGVTGAALEMIREATSTSSSQLFHYFPEGKAQLMLEVARYEADQILEQQRPLLGNFGDLGGLVQWSNDLHSQFEQQGMHCALGALLSQLDPNELRVRAVIAEMYARWEHELRQGLVLLQHDKQIAAEIDPGESAAALLTGIQGGVLMLLATGSVWHLRIALNAGLRALQEKGASDRRALVGLDVSVPVAGFGPT
jgi:AcrR family transcriptional regulator